MEKYVTIAIGSLYIIFTIIMYIDTWVTAKKNKNKAKQEELLNASKEEIYNTCMTLVQDAEKFKNYTGEEKFNWVLTRLQQLNQKIYGEVELGGLINKIVDTTKNVNNKEGKHGK